MTTKSRIRLPQNGHYQLQTPLEFSEGPFLVIDTETTGLHLHKPYPGFGHAARPFLVVIQPSAISRPILFRAHHVNPSTREVTWSSSTLRTIQRYISKHRTLVFHNALFDLAMLRAIGIDISDDVTVEDTLGAAHVLDSAENHELKVLAERYFGETPTLQSIVREKTKEARQVARDRNIPVAPELDADSWMILDFLKLDTCEQYAANDVALTEKLWKMQRALLHNHEKSLLKNYVRERRVMRDLDKMMQRPLTFSPKIQETLDRYLATASYREQALKNLVRSDIPGFNPRSSVQTSKALYEVLKLPITHVTKSGNPSTAKPAVKHLETLLNSGLKVAKQLEAETFLECLLEHRAYTTGAGYIQGYLDREVNGGIYPRFNPWGTVSTRLSSSDPNAQNVSGDERAGARICFGPPSGFEWYSFDFNQIELRIMAHVSNDPTLRDVLQSGGDVYVRLQDAVNRVRSEKRLGPINRKAAKVIWLAWQYGLGSKKLSTMTGVPAEDMYAELRTTYPGVVQFMEDTCLVVRRQGYVHTLFGYRLYIRERLNPWTDEMERPEYVGTNAIIQGTAGDMLKNSMLAVNDYIRIQGIQNRLWILMNIHDELVLECDKKLPRKRTHLKNIHKILSSAGKAINCETPVGCSIIQRDWGHPVLYPL